MLNEFYRVAFRRKIYASIEQLQDDLDLWLKEYNEERPHQGRWCYGKTPRQTFLGSLPLAREKLLPHESSLRVLTGRAGRQSRQRLPNNLTSRSAGRGQGRRQPARAAREPLTAAAREVRTLQVNLDTVDLNYLSGQISTFTNH